MNFTLARIRRSAAARALSRIFLGTLLAVTAASVPALGQATSTGVVEGRVQSATTGNYLNNARVRVTGTTREVFTNSFGEYRILDLPAGEAKLEVLFTGMGTQSVPVTVPAGGVVQKDIVLRGAAESGAGTAREDGTVAVSYTHLTLPTILRV